MPTHETLPRSPAPRWICELCYKVIYTDILPDHWDFILQTVICPECAARSKKDGSDMTNLHSGEFAPEGTTDPRCSPEPSVQSLPDPIMERREENLKTMPDLPPIEFLGGWVLGPGTMLRPFKVGDHAYTVQMAGFDGNLAELYSICTKISMAVMGDYPHIIENANLRRLNTFMIEKVIISIH
jgi:hypothetical protein